MIYIIAKTNTIQSKHICKVGVSKNPDKRLKQLQTANECELQLVKTYQSIKDYDYKIETSLQNVYYKRYKILNEWYELPREIIDNFENLCTKIESNLEHIANYSTFD